MKYNRNGEDFSCTAHYYKKELVKIICFSKERDTLLLEHYIDGLKEGSFQHRFRNGKVKEVGHYRKSWPSEVWKTFFETGQRKSYKYYRYHIEYDSSTLYYEKIFNPDGGLERMMLPIEYRIEPREEEYFNVGDEYELYIDLLYSEYDSVNSMLLIDPSTSSGVKGDTVFYAGRSGLIKFTPQEVGNHSISGTYIEVDGNDPNPDEKKVAEKPFRFDYEAIE